MPPPFTTISTSVSTPSRNVTALTPREAAVVAGDEPERERTGQPLGEIGLTGGRVCRPRRTPGSQRKKKRREGRKSQSQHLEFVPGYRSTTCRAMTHIHVDASCQRVRLDSPDLGAHTGSRYHRSHAPPTSIHPCFRGPGRRHRVRRRRRRGHRRGVRRPGRLLRGRRRRGPGHDRRRDRVPRPGRGRYCTHQCETDDDCCLVDGECDDSSDARVICSPFENESGIKRCFLACEVEDIGDLEENDYCHEFAHEEFGCRSSGGGSENRKSASRQADREHHAQASACVLSSASWRAFPQGSSLRRLHPARDCSRLHPRLAGIPPAHRCTRPTAASRRNAMRTWSSLALVLALASSACVAVEEEDPTVGEDSVAIVGGALTTLYQAVPGHLFRVRRRHRLAVQRKPSSRRAWS